MNSPNLIFFKFFYLIVIKPLLQLAEQFENLTTEFWENWGQSWHIWNPTSPPNWGQSPQTKPFLSRGHWSHNMHWSRREYVPDKWAKGDKNKKVPRPQKFRTQFIWVTRISHSQKFDILWNASSTITLHEKMGPKCITDILGPKKPKFHSGWPGPQMWPPTPGFSSQWGRPQGGVHYGPYSSDKSRTV